MKALALVLFAVGIGAATFALLSWFTPTHPDEIVIDCSHATPGVTYIAKPYGGPQFTFTCGRAASQVTVQ